eukprot:s3579_g4.t1
MALINLNAFDKPWDFGVRQVRKTHSVFALCFTPWALPCFNALVERNAGGYAGGVAETDHEKRAVLGDWVWHSSRCRVTGDPNWPRSVSQLTRLQLSNIEGTLWQLSFLGRSLSIVPSAQMFQSVSVWGEVESDLGDCQRSCRNMQNAEFFCLLSSL